MAEAGVNSKTVRVNAKVEAQNAKMECPRSNASTDKWNEESRVFAQRSAHPAVGQKVVFGSKELVYRA